MIFSASGGHALVQSTVSSITVLYVWFMMARLFVYVLRMVMSCVLQNDDVFGGDPPDMK